MNRKKQWIAFHSEVAGRLGIDAGAEKALLQTLAVIGRESRLDLIREMVPTAEGQLHDMLAELQASEFIYEQPAFPQAEFVFKHALTQEVTYNSMLLEQRKALHELYAKIAESNFSHEVLATSPEDLMVMRVGDVGWSDLGEPARVLSTMQRIGLEASWAMPAA